MLCCAGARGHRSSTNRIVASNPSCLQAQAAEELANAALALSHYQAATDADEVDLDLIESLLAYICEVRKDLCQHYDLTLALDDRGSLLACICEVLC